MNKIKKTNMNIKKITIAMLITLISIGNINAQEMKTEMTKISQTVARIEVEHGEKLEILFYIMYDIKV